MNTGINLQDHILLWNASAVKVMDVRHMMMTAGMELRSYRFPASGFLYSMRGGARILLDGTEHAAERFHLLHGGKGACLDIELTGELFEYYLIFYKAKIPLPCRRDILQRMERYNPFQLQYGFEPLHPVALLDKADHMRQAWRHAGELDKFQVKTLFYQFVYEVLRQMEHQHVGMEKPNLAAQIIRYIHEHYRETITRESIAQLFHYNADYLSRQFRRETGHSVIDYWIGVKIAKAGELLRTTDMTIQEAADSVGYADVSYFARIFKKQTGMTPKAFQQRAGMDPASPDRPIAWSGSSIVPRKRRRYIENGYDNRSQYDGEGVFSMYRHTSSMAVSVLLGLTLLLSACSGTAGTNTATGSPNAAPSAGAAQSAWPEGQDQASPTRFKHVMGEIDVPPSPKRITGLYMEDHLIALGINPVTETVGTYSHQYLQPYFVDRMKIDPSSIDFEALLMAKPDLILLNHPYNGSEGKYAQFSKIAPTYVFDDGQWLHDWRGTLRTIGDLAGKKAEAEQFIQQYEDKVADARKKLQSAIGDETVALIRVENKKLILYGGPAGYVGNVLYTDLGVTPPEVVKRLAWGDTPHAAVSLEVIPELTADHLFITTYPNEESKELANEIYNSPLWKKLPAVQNGNVHEMDPDYWMTSGPIAYGKKVDDVLKALVR